MRSTITKNETNVYSLIKYLLYYLEDSIDFSEEQEVFLQRQKILSENIYIKKTNKAKQKQKPNKTNDNKR